MQLFVLSVPLVADRLLDFLPLLPDGGGGDGDGRVAQLKVDLADPGTGQMYRKSNVAPQIHPDTPAFSVLLK